VIFKLWKIGEISGWILSSIIIIELDNFHGIFIL